MKSEIYYTDSPIHPGEFLRETVEEMKISQVEFSKRLGISRKVLNEIYSGKNPITPRSAILIERVLGTPAHVWNNLQSNYDLNVEYLLEKKKIESDFLELNKFPISNMVKNGWIQKKNSAKEKVIELYNFFGISSFENLEHSLAIQFRRSIRPTFSREAVFAWIRKGEIESQSIKTDSFNKKKLKSHLSELRALTRETPDIFQKQLKEICSSAGVAVVFIPELPNTFINGASYWINSNKAAVLLSLRFKTNDHLWFSFFHELGHILLHGKRESFINLENLQISPEEELKENEANTFARDLLIPPNDWEQIVNDPPYSKQKIIDYARKLDIAPGIIVGRLQKEEFLPWTHLNKLKKKYKWAS